jgi:hypothetical protein
VEGRNTHPLEHLMGLEEAVKAKLTRAELVALRLYTGPMVGTLQPQILLVGPRCNV